MTHSQTALSLMLGRMALGALFFISGTAKIGRFAGVAGFMASKGLPAAEVLLAATIALEIVAGLALIAGWRVRYAAWTLLGFTALATGIFHAFWAADAATFQNQLNHFLKNIAVMGGLLLVGTAGAGTWSIEGARTQRP